MTKPLLEMKNIKKYFSGVVALKGVDFSVNKGEIHGLIGQNGAGKSTLIKVLTGVYRPDEGQIYFKQKEIDKNVTIHDIQNIGISTIYQELSLIPYLSIAENIFLGRENKKNGLIDWRQNNLQAEQILEEFGITGIDVTQPVSQLSAAYQQITSIARAISFEAQLIIMDESTSSLDDHEVHLLFDIIRQLSKKDIAVVFVSHRLSELFEICDRVTVLKDGSYIGTYEINRMTEEKLIGLMLGKEFKQQNHMAATCNNNAEKLLEVENICFSNKLRHININILRGEVVGLAGLLGSGRTELADVIFGVKKESDGKIKVDGKEVKIHTPRDAMKLGIAYLTEERKVNGIAPNMSVRENLTIASLKQYSRWGFVSKNKEFNIVKHYVSNLNIVTPNQEKKINELSGGNQQKVIIAKWLATNPKLIIFDEPTRGIDVGAKAEIEKQIHILAEQGISILMISSDINELIRNCSRIFVLREGEQVGELCNEEITEENILYAIAGGNRKK